MEDIPKDYDELLKLYNNLKNDFDEQSQIYEEYISSLEKTKKDNELQLKAKEKEQEAYKKEILKLKEANIDRNKDIEYLEKEKEKIDNKFNQYKDMVKSLENKLVESENESTQYSNKIRELEFYCEDYKNKLDAALEENIILHSEHEAFKMECDERMQRIQEELEDNKNEVLSKEKLISKLTSHRDFLIKTAKDEINSNIQKISSKNDIDNKSMNESIRSNKIKDTQSISSNKKIPENFILQISNSFLNSAKEINKELEKGLSKEENFILHKIQNEVKQILENRRTFIMATLIEESFSFDILNIEGPAKLGKIKTAVKVNEAIDEVLMKLRERKDKVLTQKRLLQAKFEKLGIKIS